jgi:transcriptional regulator with XRE-family HTH domain
MKTKKTPGRKSDAVASFKKRLLDVLGEEQQNWWSSQLGISQSVISSGWKKKSYPRSDNLIKICEIKGISANWLLLGVGPKYIEDLDDKKIAEMQSKKNETQYKIMAQDEKVLRLEERIHELERALKCVDVSNLAKFNIGKENSGRFEETNIFDSNILPLLTLMRLMQDVLFKAFEEYSKTSMSDDRFNNIFDYLTKNFEANKYSVISSLKELDSKFK